MDKRAYRETIGEKLREFREDRRITPEEVAKVGGIPVDKIKEIENGSDNYTMDEFIGYIIGSDLYLYFSEKSENRKRPHDFNDMADKAIKNDPESQR